MFFVYFPTFLTLVERKKIHVLMNKMLLRMKKKNCFHRMFDKSCGYGEKLKRLQVYVCQTFGKHFVLFVFADNFTGLKDTEPYKTDVSCLCQYSC